MQYIRLNLQKKTLYVTDFHKQNLRQDNVTPKSAQFVAIPKLQQSNTVKYTQISEIHKDFFLLKK